MMLVDRLTGQPIQVVPSVPQQPALSLGQAFALTLLGIGAAAFISDVADEIGKLFSPQKANRRNAGHSGRWLQEELSDLEWVFYRTGGKCLYCGKTLCIDNRGYYGGRGSWEPDHFIAFSRGGADQPYNLLPACVDCNRAKGNLWPWQFDARFGAGDRNPENYV